MQVIAEYKKKILLGVILAVIIAAGLAASAIWIAPKSSTQSSNITILNGSQLIVQLTDPPVVPQGTTSLNLTYTEIDLLVAEPGTSAQSISIVPSGGSATVDLMKLQNVSQTLALANLPNGSEILSATFVVSSIEIEINGTASPVTLATGGNTLLMTLTEPAAVQGTNALLLELNPTIINASTGYQMVPSSLGVLKPQSEITPSDNKVGYTQELSDQDQSDLHHDRGSISANLVALSVSGSTTMMSIQVTNTGNGPARLVLFGIHGNFTWVCPTVVSSDSSGDQKENDCDGGVHEIVFIPGAPQTTTVAATTTVSGCAPRHMTLVNGPDVRSDLINPIVMNPGQCLTFSFSGAISFGDSGNHILVPSTESGQKYIVHVVATNGAEIKIRCTLQESSSANCAIDHDDNGED